MILRRLSAVVAVAMLASALSGCVGAPAPGPSPTPTPVFASQEEAFAAAEETYRAYVDALNAVDLSEPATFEDVFAWTIGDVRAQEKKSLSMMHAEGWTVAGATQLAGFMADEYSPLSLDATVTALVCSDVSEIEVRDSEGQSMVRADRPPVFALQVQFGSTTQTSTGLAVATSTNVEDARCAQS